MKRLLTIALISICQFSYSQVEYTGQNPIAVKYKAAHFGLKGKVKSITNYAPDGKTILSVKEFEYLGRLLKDSTEAGMSSAVTYYTYDDSKNNAIVERFTRFGNVPLVDYYKFNSEKEVTHQYLGRPDKLIHLYKYEGKNLVLDSIDNFIRKYTYNQAGQIETEKRYDQKGIITSSKLYTYKTRSGELTIDTESTIDGEKVIWKNIFKFSDGNVVSETYSDAQAITTTVYERDKQGNVISQKTEKKYFAQEHQQYNYTGTTKWAIQYY